MARGATYRTDKSWAVLAALAFGSREPARPIGVPTLVVAGAQDLVTPAHVLRPLADALTYEIVTGAVLKFLARDAS